MKVQFVKVFDHLIDVLTAKLKMAFLGLFFEWSENIPEL